MQPQVTMELVMCSGAGARDVGVLYVLHRPGKLGLNLPRSLQGAALREQEEFLSGSAQPISKTGAQH